MQKGEIEKLERILKALANKRRLAIVRYLKRRKEASVGSIAEAIQLSFRSTSHHLRLLAAAEVLEKRQIQTVMLYTIAEPVSSTFKSLVAIV